MWHLQDSINVRSERNYTWDFSSVKDLDPIIEDYEALSWAMKNPDYDYKALIPLLNHTNEEMFYYLTRWYEMDKAFLKERGVLGDEA